jgi:maleate cis-trans isomerase
LEIAEEAERATGLPVLTSNMASLWAALDHLKKSGPSVPKTALFGLLTLAERRAARS